MKRSEINQIIGQAKAIFDEYRWVLPPFAYFTPEDWAAADVAYDEIKECMLGWDITDFGSGDFYRTGLLMFTLRNANLKKPSDQPYAEKLLLVREGQVTPCHFHWNKMEDIINRGGGNLMVKLHESTPDEQLSDAPIRVKIDGRFVDLQAGALVKIEPGSSITMHTGLYHSFWGEEGAGTVIVGEVSKVNDDTIDNRFLTPCGRFPAIDEDEPPVALLMTEYP